MILYRIATTGFALFQAARHLLRGDLPGLRARLGLNRPETDAPHLWLHAASNGELASARVVIDALLADSPSRHLLVTCNSATGVAMAQGWALPRVTARLAPLDLAWVARRLHRRWRVRGLIVLESELWPHRILTCPGPVCLLGARLTPRSARGWARLGALVPRVLGRIAYASAQDAGSRERLLSLGLPPGACGPDLNLKTLYRPDMAPFAAEAERLREVFPRSNTWLAASTHAGEEEVVMQAHRIARETDPGLRLILAPRHPRRGAEVRALVKAAGFRVAQRSRGEDTAGADVYLADTLGEMPLWYSLSGRVFVGGSLTDRGGHTPYEPATFGAALLHGPDVANFFDGYAALHAVGAAVRIEDAEGLAAALMALSDADIQADKGHAAAGALAGKGAAEDVLAQVLRLFA